MKQKEKKARNRRTNEQIDKEVISELEKLVAEYGFGNVNLSALMKAANIEANVFIEDTARWTIFTTGLPSSMISGSMMLLTFPT
mgnify:CR=1 FL=1